MAIRIIRKLRDLLDVDTSGASPGDALVLDVDGETWVPGAGGGGSDDQTAAEVPFTPAGNIAATNVQTALQELDTEKAAAASAVLDGDAAGGVLGGTYPSPSFAVDMATQAELDAVAAAKQPLDSDLTAIAALSTTSFGRSLLALADAAALLAAAGAAAASHVHAGEDVTSGTVADARIASTIARDSEVTAAIAALSAVYQPLDSDLTAIAALTTTAFGRGLLDDADAAAARTTLGLVIGTDVEAHDTDLTTIAGLSPSNDDVIQRKAGAWTNRTIAQLLSDLGLAALYQPLDSDLTAFAGLSIAADKLPYGNGSHTLTLADFTAFARTLLDDADASTVLSTLGVSTFIKTLLDDADAATARATLGISGGALHSGYALLRDEKSSGTNGGNSSSGAWRTRDLNTESFDVGGIVSLSSNQFTLGAGTYFIRAHANAFGNRAHACRVYNVTDSTVAVQGSAEWGSTAGATYTESQGAGRITIAGTKTFELQYQVEASATNGLGSATGWGTEVYAEVEIWKEA